MNARKVLNIIGDILFILVLVAFIVIIATEIYKNINVVNKISKPEDCIMIDKSYYCKVSEK